VYEYGRGNNNTNGVVCVEVKREELFFFFFEFLFSSSSWTTHKQSFWSPLFPPQIFFPLSLPEKSSSVLLPLFFFFFFTRETKFVWSLERKIFTTTDKE
jgi:hypothetical protein